MSRYALKLIEALDKKDLDLTLILNKSLGLDKEKEAIIRAASPSAKILFLKLSYDPKKHGGWQKLQKLCAKELDSQLKGLLQPEDTYLIASNFALRYCSVFPSLDSKKALIFYDLTPYLHWGDYRLTPDFEPKKYFSQFRILFEADQLWAISQSAGDEAIHWLGINPQKVKNIRGASIRNLHDEKHKPETMNGTKFVLCPSADGPHKNNEVTAKAFAEFNSKAGEKYKLVLTSDFTKKSKVALASFSEDIIFTGHVTDGELSWLYENCEALLFVSKTEGLGLPVLEAVSAGKKVICSDIKVFREISEKSFYFANPADSHQIAEVLSEALSKSKNWEEKKAGYAEITKKFSWPAAADNCIEMINRLISIDAKSSQKLIVHYSDPDHASKSRDYTELLYAANPGAKYAYLRSFKYKHSKPSYLPEMGVAVNTLAGKLRAEDKGNVYIVDNSEEGAKLLLYALDRPGKTVLAYEKGKLPIHINNYLELISDHRLNYELLEDALKVAGCELLYKPRLSKRGGQKLLDEISQLNQDIAG